MLAGDGGALLGGPGVVEGVAAVVQGEPVEVVGEADVEAVADEVELVAGARVVQADDGRAVVLDEGGGAAVDNPREFLPGESVEESPEGEGLARGQLTDARLDDRLELVVGDVVEIIVAAACTEALEKVLPVEGVTARRVMHKQLRGANYPPRAGMPRGGLVLKAGSIRARCGPRRRALEGVEGS